MKAKKTNGPRFAICMKNKGYAASLDRYKIYRVLPDDDAATMGQLRIVDESGEDYLYPSRWFIIVPLELEKELLKAS